MLTARFVILDVEVSWAKTASRYIRGAVLVIAGGERWQIYSRPLEAIKCSTQFGAPPKWGQGCEASVHVVLNR